MNSVNPDATKYLVKAKINADGIVDKPDVVGAIFGQTEGLLGDDLDLRDLQKSGRIGRIEVEVVSKGGKSDGIIYMSSSLDQVETVILAASLETIDRVGPCKAGIKVLGIEDVRVTKREKIMERAKELLGGLVEQAKGTSANLTQTIRESVQVDEITTYGKERCPAGPNVKSSEAIIIVEGRSDVINLLKAGIKNAVAVEGTNIPRSVQELSRERITTAFVDGDRGGELILRELFQTSEIDFVARAPRAHEVEELSAKQLVKCLRNKVPGDQYMEMNGLSFEEKELAAEEKDEYVDEEPVVEEPRRARREYDDHYGRGERRSKRDRYNKDRHGRRKFDNENYSAEKWKKREEPVEEEEITDQVVDIIPTKRKMMEEEPDTPVEKKNLRKKSRRERVYEDVPTEDIENEVVEAIAVEESETAPAVEEPEKQEEPVEETPEAPVVEEVPEVEEKEEAVPEVPADPVVEDKEEPAPVAEVPAVEKPSVEEAPVETEPATEEPVAEEPVEKPKKRVIRGKKSVKNEKVLTDEQNAFKDLLQSVSGTRNSILLDANGETIDKVEVKNLANYLKETASTEISSIVFDGVISQNIVDISSGKGIKTLVCKRKGKIAKLPAELTVLERSDLI